jgi:tetratricopeptide (TPR) repeat protein
VLLSPAHASAQTLSGGGFDSYRRAIERFRDRDERALAWLAPSSPAHLSRWAARAIAELPPVELKAAAILHTDAAIGHLRDGDGGGLAAHHLEAAERLFDAVLKADRTAVSFARRWHAVVEGYLHAAGRAGEANALAARAAARLGSDANWLRFLRGLRHELDAGIAGPISPSDGSTHATALDPLARDELTRAAREFASAMTVDPTLVEAALHLGRVYAVLGSAEQAVTPLEQAARSSDPGVACLARLFLGAVAERLDRHEEAESHYRAAMGIFRWGQSAPLALSQLLARTGRASEARQTLRRHFESTSGRVSDPLWTYLVDPSDHLGSALERLRAGVWR